VAGAGVFEDPWGEVVFESVDSGFEDANVGVDAAHIEVCPASFLDEAGSLRCE
jgi:hypothetical protein